MGMPVGALFSTAAAESAASSATAGGAALQAMLMRLEATRASRGPSDMGGSTDKADAAGTAAHHLPGADLPAERSIVRVRDSAHTKCFRAEHESCAVLMGSSCFRDAGRPAPACAFQGLAWCVEHGRCRTCLNTIHCLQQGLLCSCGNSSLPTPCLRRGQLHEPVCPLH